MIIISRQTFGAAVMAGALILSPLLADGAWARAACDITDLKCWGPNKKCNIKFRNKTGEQSGFSHKDVKQMSKAITIYVKAMADDGERLGERQRLEAGDTRTINLDNRVKLANQRKVTLSHIRISGLEFPVGTYDALLKCDTIRSVLNGSGTCVVFIGKDDKLHYKCDGGDVIDSND